MSLQRLLLGILLAGAFGILEAKIPAVATLEYFYAKDGTVTGRSVNGMDSLHTPGTVSVIVNPVIRIFGCHRQETIGYEKPDTSFPLEYNFGGIHEVKDLRVSCE